MLASEGPASVGVSCPSGIAIGEETNVHDLADLFVGRIKLCEDELMASGAQSLEVQVHLDGITGRASSDK